MAIQYKWKLSYLALLASSCFVQSAVADESAVGFFCQSSYGTNEKTSHNQYNDVKIGKCILGTSRNIIGVRSEAGFFAKFSSGNIKQNVQEKNITTRKDPELIFVKDGASLRDYILYDGAKAYFSNDGEKDKPGLSINNTVRDGGEIHVYAGGISENSKIEQGGTEIVEALKGKQGFSRNAIVKEGGQQHVGNGGKVEGTKIYGGKQLVFGEGEVAGQVEKSSASNIIIYGQNETLGKQKVYDGGITSNIKVMRGGVQEIFKEDYDAKNGGSAFDTEVFGGGKQRILEGGKAIGVILNETATQEIHTDGFVKNLTINDKAESWVRAGATLAGKTLVGHSGKINLYAGNDQHRTTVEDILLNGKDTKLYSIATGGDGKSSLIEKLSGEGSVLFAFTGSDPYYSQLHVNNLSGSLHFKFNTAIAHNRGDYLFVENGKGNHTISVADSGVEITHPLSQKRDLITDRSGGADFTLTDLFNEKINAVDGGTYMYGLKQRKDENGKVWFLSADRTGGPDPSPPDPINPFVPGEPSTTPSTDAILSMGVTSGLIFNNELQSVRAGRGILDKNRKNTNLWGYAIKSGERIATGHTNFKLEQTGIVFGVDQLNELPHGELYVGGFGSYDQARIVHARGGDSDLNSYSVGAYATYFDNRRWYLDGILKYNYFWDNLKAISTNGLNIQGDYNQWAIGGSFELGCRFEPAQNTWMQPYVKVTGVRVADKKIKLSNGMIADINSSISLPTEVGLTTGHEFIVGAEASLTAYITAAWLHENVDNNYTMINNKHKFITDLSGNMGKLGIGLNSFVNNKLTFYAEANYLTGHRIKESVRGVLGFRYSF
ncbi:BafA family autotransporter [Bartonella doshiae]|uniref:Adhesin/invasin TibA autotransporter n=2 Tax=Bartonella doshiae TaxID=33044 RepID=A0A380ZE98_BARDO|nr:BafA family autotransporter [Bartonella doshiae]EJF81889.1 outer membrane autotransporter barrel domain-containing protein [Bartonella doshiae NCTC 12862 = ATCC 700133]MBB6159399.1 outer membrane autotransporter protein [Bartonella doshiae]SUV44684.1 Adhesin/invasin TibA autotransporter precursor [Bartonella doshiae]